MKRKLLLVGVTLSISSGWAFAGEDPSELLALPGFLTLVQQRSPELAFAEADREAARARLQSAKKDLYPAFDADYLYRHQPDSTFSFGVGNVKNLYSYGVTVEQPLYRGRALVTAVEKSKLAVAGTGAAIGEARNALLRRAYGAYYRLLNARNLESEAEQAVLRLAAHRRDALAFYDAGLVPRNGYLEAEVELAQGEQDLLAARNLVRLAHAAMNVMMGRQATAPFQVEDVLQAEPRGPAWDEALANAMTLRPEIEQAQLAIEQADKDIILAKAPFRPWLTASAGYQKQGDEPLAASHPFVSSDEKTAQVSASWRFWAWGKGGNEATAARQEVRKAGERFAQLTDAITLEVRQAFLDLEEAEKNIPVTRKAIEQAEENYRISQERFQAQLATATEVLDAQTLLTRARTNYHTALFEYNLALVDLDWATGALAHKGSPGAASPLSSAYPHSGCIADRPLLRSATSGDR